jgi:hypothetical protein
MNPDFGETMDGRQDYQGDQFPLTIIETFSPSSWCWCGAFNAPALSANQRQV